AVLDERAHEARGELGSERQVAPAAVLEGVHLLLDYEVGGFTHRLLENLGEFEDRWGDSAGTCSAQHLLCGAGDGAPGGLVAREDVLCAFHGLELHRPGVYTPALMRPKPGRPPDQAACPSCGARLAEELPRG